MIKIQKVSPAGWKVTEDDTVIYFGEFGRFGCYQNDGVVYKDREAFETGTGMCYISEYSFDSVETLENEKFYNFKHPEEIPEEFKYTILKNPHWGVSGETRESLEDLCQDSNYDVEDLFDHLDWMCAETLVNESEED